MADAAEANAVLKPYMLAGSPRLLTIGTFDDRVTVLSQQRRALNLVWSLIEANQMPTRAEQKRLQVAVVGAGFAGLTFAAALIQKRCRCEVTIFEERDTLLPLQQGSDTRWLHPHIYDWPEEGSEVAAAMLPVLNWTAARASDVVVQVLSAWKELAQSVGNSTISVFCNARHLQIAVPGADSVVVEWVGDKRKAADGTALEGHTGAKGLSAKFDLVVLAIGFGLEIHNPSSSYWRNEVLGQPSLGQPQKTFLVSGQGDGAMIDLLRLKISQFRQDRILAELFSGKNELLRELRSLRIEYLKGNTHYQLFERFEGLSRKRRSIGVQMNKALNLLSGRLRRDTEIVLQLKVRNIAALLEPGTSRTSFQNALLVFMLYRCGGFAPSCEEDELVLVTRFGIQSENVVRRHGTARIEQLTRLLPPTICDPIIRDWEATRCVEFKQTQEIRWTGGYFGIPGRAEDFGAIDDKKRRTWRREYLPGPTALVAASMAGAVSGALADHRPEAKHFRVTVHRVLRIHDEDLLQQACDYFGKGIGEGSATAGRTFPARNATIGAAYRTRRIVYSRPGLDPSRLGAAMKALSLNEASREMASEVSFVSAIPILQPEDDFFEPSPVCSVVYFDSRDKDFHLDESEFKHLKILIAHIGQVLGRGNAAPLDRLGNTPLRPRSKVTQAAEKLPAEATDALVLSSVDPPRLGKPFLFNYDHSDLTPLAD